MRLIFRVIFNTPMRKSTNNTAAVLYVRLTRVFIRRDHLVLDPSATVHFYFSIIMQPSLWDRIMRIHPLCLSVCPMPTVNSKTEKLTTFKLRGQVAYVRSNWQNNFEVKMSD